MCVADFFNKVAGSRTATLLKIDFNTGEIFESFKNTLFYRKSLVAASDSFIFSACNFVKKETPVKMFFCEFCEIFKNIFLMTEHLRMTASSVYLWILRSFSEHLFYRAPRWAAAYFI